MALLNHAQKKVGVPRVVREVADLIDREQTRLGVPFQGPFDSSATRLLEEFVEHVGGCDEHRLMARARCLVHEIFREHGFAETRRAQKQDVGFLRNEPECKQIFDKFARNAFGPLPVEARDRLDVADFRSTQESPLAPLLRFSLFPIHEGATECQHLWVVLNHFPIGKKSMQAKRVSSLG